MRYFGTNLVDCSGHSHVRTPHCELREAIEGRYIGIDYAVH